MNWPLIFDGFKLGVAIGVVVGLAMGISYGVFITKEFGKMFRGD